MAESKTDRLVVEYDYLAEDDMHVLSVVREDKDEVISMVEGNIAEFIYEILKGERVVSYYEGNRVLMEEL